jgi:hypothetical protein
MGVIWHGDFNSGVAKEHTHWLNVYVIASHLEE